jgi:hypothetical protein
MNGASNSKVLGVLVDKAGHGVLNASVDGMSLNLMLALAKRFEDYLGKEFVCAHDDDDKVVIRLKNTNDRKALNWSDGVAVEATDLMVFDSIPKITVGDELDMQAIVVRTNYAKRGQK